MRTYELKATKQKSFYGKATVTEKDAQNAVLTSYTTEVCGFVNGEFVRFWGGWSATTAKHIDAFRELFGLRGLSKKEWLALPVSRFDWVHFYIPAALNENRTA